MSLTFNTNLSSLNSQRNLSKSQNTLKTSLERLSSGLRINSAKDDAAGLAISDRMTSQIRGLNQALRNANDGISLAQTAEGAMQEDVNILQRIRELAVQSANDTNSARDRASLQAEVNQLIQELDRIGHTTEFNNLTLLDGTFTNRIFQIGANANQTITVSIDSVLAADLSFVGTVIDAGTTETGISVDGTIINAGALTINGNAMRATEGTAVDTAKAINEANANGVTGVANIATTVNVQSFDFDMVDLTSSTLPMGTPSVVTPGTDSDPAVTENATYTFSPLEAGQSITIGGMTVTASGGQATAADIAATFAGVDAGNASANGTTLSGWSTVDGLTFISDTSNIDIAVNLTATGGGPSAAADLVPSTAFIDGDPTAGNATISFDFALPLLQGQGLWLGVQGSLWEEGREVFAETGDMTAAEVAQAFLSTTSDGATVGNGTVTGDVGWTGVSGGGNIVNFDSGSDATGQTPLKLSPFWRAYGFDFTHINTIQGSPTQTETVTFDYPGPLWAGTSVNIGGMTVTAEGGTVDPADIAATFAGVDTGNASSNGTSLVGWSTVDGYTFVSDTPFTNVPTITVKFTEAPENLYTGDPFTAFLDGDPTTNNATISFDFNELLAGQTMTVGGRTVTVTSGDMTAAEVAQAFLTSTLDGATIGNGTVSGDVGWTGISGGGNVVNFDSGSSATGQTALTAVGGGVGSAADIIADNYNEGHADIPASPSNMTITGITDFAAINGSTIQLGGTDIQLDWTVTGTITGWGDVTTQSDLVAILNAQAGINASALSTDGVTITTEALGAPTPASTLSAGAYGLYVTYSGSGDYALELDGADVVIAGEDDGIVTSQDVVDAINNSSVPGFTASIDDNGKVVITKTDGASFTIREKVDPSGSFETNSGGIAGITSAAVLLEGQVQLSSSGDIVIKENAGTGALAASGLAHVGNATTTIDFISVATREDALVAISSVDLALEEIDAARGNLGAVQNRFESTISNLQNISENLSTARSRIMDADIAAETSEMTKQNILQQAGVTILSQANMQPELALSLLQG